MAARLAGWARSVEGDRTPGRRRGFASSPRTGGGGGARSGAGPARKAGPASGRGLAGAPAPTTLACRTLFRMEEARRRVELLQAGAPLGPRLSRTAPPLSLSGPGRAPGLGLLHGGSVCSGCPKSTACRTVDMSPAKCKVCSLTAK